MNRFRFRFQIGLFCFLLLCTFAGDLRAQYFDTDDFALQLEKRQVSDLHFVLGSGSDPMSVEPTNVLRLLRTRIPVDGKSPMVVLDPELHWTMAGAFPSSMTSFGRFAGVLDFLIKERGTATHAKFDLLTMGNVDHSRWSADLEHTNLAFDSYRSLASIVDHDRTLDEISKVSEVQMIHSKQIESEMGSLSNLETIKQVHLTIIGGDSQTIIFLFRLMELMASQKQPRKVHFNLYLLLTEGSAGSKILATYDLQRKYPWASVWLARENSTEFVAMDSAEGATLARHAFLQERRLSREEATLEPLFDVSGLPKKYTYPKKLEFKLRQEFDASLRTLGIGLSLKVVQSQPRIVDVQIKDELGFTEVPYILVRHRGRFTDIKTKVIPHLKPQSRIYQAPILLPKNTRVKIIVKTRLGSLAFDSDLIESEGPLMVGGWFSTYMTKEQIIRDSAKIAFEQKVSSLVAKEASPHANIKIDLQPFDFFAEEMTEVQVQILKLNLSCSSSFDGHDRKMVDFQDSLKILEARILKLYRDELKNMYADLKALSL